MSQCEEPIYRGPKVSCIVIGKLLSREAYGPTTDICLCCWTSVRRFLRSPITDVRAETLPVSQFLVIGYGRGEILPDLLPVQRHNTRGIYQLAVFDQWFKAYYSVKRDKQRRFLTIIVSS